MYETYPKKSGGNHKRGKHEVNLSGWKGDSGQTRYPSGGGKNDIDTNETKQQRRAAFNNGGGNQQVSARYPQSGGKNGKSFDTDCNY